MTLDVGKLEKDARRCLSNYKYRDAMLYADLIRAQDPKSEELVTVQADIQAQCNEHIKAIESLNALKKELKSLKAKLLYTKCCEVLKRYDGFNSALVRWTPSVSGTTNKALISRLTVLSRRLFVERSDSVENFTIGALFESIGHIFLAQFNHELAAEAFRLSLRADPSSVSTIESACDTLGHRLDINQIISEFPPDFDEKIVILDKRTLFQAAYPGHKRSVQDGQQKSKLTDDIRPPTLPPPFRKLHKPAQNQPKRSSANTNNNNNNVLSPNQRNKRKVLKKQQHEGAEQLQFRSSEFGSRDSVKENANDEDALVQSTAAAAASMTISNVLATYAKAYYAFANFDFNLSLDYLDSFDFMLDNVQVHRASILRARCHFEMGDNDKCLAAFERLRSLFSLTIEGLEYYGTALWRKRDILGLTTLSHQLEQIAPLKAVTWCTVGNCMSAVGDTETSVKLFKRALSIDDTPSKLQTYALLLLASEFLDLRRYRDLKHLLKIIIRREPRCFRAYYLYGLSSFQQEVFSNAVYFFTKAEALNPNNVALVTHLAVSFYKLSKISESYQALDRASKLNPSDRQLLLHMAGIFMMTNRKDDALEVMKRLLAMDTQNNAYHYMIAKAYKMMDTNAMYVKHLNFCEGMMNQKAYKAMLDSLYNTNKLAYRFGELVSAAEAQFSPENKNRVMRITRNE